MQHPLRCGRDRQHASKYKAVLWALRQDGRRGEREGPVAKSGQERRTPTLCNPEDSRGQARCRRSEASSPAVHSRV